MNYPLGFSYVNSAACVRRQPSRRSLRHTRPRGDRP